MKLMRFTESTSRSSTECRSAALLLASSYVLVLTSGSSSSDALSVVYRVHFSYVT
jgi:hypothetical protein